MHVTRPKPIQEEAIWGAALLLFFATLAALARGTMFTLYQVQDQDLPILFCLPLLLLMLAYRAPVLALPNRLPPVWLLLAGGFAIVLLLGVGSYWIMGNFPLSRDEHMVVFDMAVFGKGRLAAPIVPEWREYAAALVPAFLRNSHQPLALVSDYLPMNALLRLGFSQIADPAFFNPMLALIGGIALFDIARTLFGDDTRARWVVLLVYALSTQVLVAAMTTYAMTAHMALNLVWVAAFLRGGKAGHGIAITIAFTAVGLHQLAFHPLFAAPFLLWRLRQGQWRVVLLYGLAYVAIVGWWFSYPGITAAATGISPGGEGENGIIADKIVPLLFKRDPYTISLMLLNLLRFIAWQNLALIPLLFAAVPVAWRAKTIAAPLLWGILAFIIFITIVLPFQGHGWGYRYLHPFLGNFALLAGLGYQRLAARIGQRADGTVLILSAATLVLAFPFLLTRTYAFVAPHVALEQLIAEQKTDFVVLDTENVPSLDGRWAANAIDNVRNSPDLDNPTLRFSSIHLGPVSIGALCRRGSITMVSRRDMHAAGFALNASSISPRFSALMHSIANKGCLRPLRHAPIRT